MAKTNSKSVITAKPVWFITGCSTGFGRELAKHMLERGYRTVMTARNPEVLVRIANTGPQIPPADRDRIFERFTAPIPLAAGGWMEPVWG
jgi:NADP-dependent 3-hydroxy acid dehydrogenase YdfG